MILITGNGLKYAGAPLSIGATPAYDSTTEAMYVATGLATYVSESCPVVATPQSIGGVIGDDEFIVVAKSNPLTGGIEISAGGSSIPVGDKNRLITGAMAVQPDMALHVSSASALDMSSIPVTAVPAGSAGRVAIHATLTDKLIETGKPSIPVRFSVATWVPDPTYIPLPDDRARLTAGLVHLRACGYNAIRIHGVENWLMAGIDGAVTFNTTRIDLFDFFLAEAKRIGLYWIINPQSYNLYTDMDGATNRFSYTSASNCKPRVYVEQDIRDNWKLGFEALYNRVNNYTGTNILQDPALAQIELYNESGIAFTASTAFPAQWKTRTVGSTVAAKTWQEWLEDVAQAHGYANLAALNTSWGTAHASYAAAAATALPALASGMSGTQQNIDALIYALWLEDDIAAFYQSCMTAWGYSGLSVMHNLFPNNVVSRNVGKLAINKVCNTHGYSMLAPSLTIGATLTTDNKSIWNSEGWLFATAMMGSGKPKWYGEHGWPSWGKYRNQYPIMFAMAAMQGASAVSYFSQGDFFAETYENDTSTQGDRHRRVNPYHNPSDPTTDFIRVLQNVVFVRGDVAESAVSQGLVLNDKYYGVSPRNTGRIGRALSYLYQPLYFLSGLAKTSLNYTADTSDDSLAATWNAKSWLTLLTDMQTAGAVSADNLSLVSATQNSGSISAVATTGTVAGGTASVTQPILTIPACTLVDGDVVFITNLTGSVGTWPGTNNKSGVCVVDVLDSTHIQITSGLNLTGLSGANFTAGTYCEGPNVFQSGTKEWGMSRRLKYCWIDTAKTKYVGNEAATLPVNLTNLRIDKLTAGAAVFVTSLDGNPITTSRHMLIGLVGDAQNAGMTFSDGAAQKVIGTTGDYPILVTDAECQMRINTTPSATPKLLTIGRDGARTGQSDSLPVDTTGVFVDVRTGQGATVFWELIF